ncbi:MAG TPA: biosynthetic peptidoglycan transglycosylase, partial [Candidatus Limnocylindria bacterium]
MLHRRRRAPASLAAAAAALVVLALPRFAPLGPPETAGLAAGTVVVDAQGAVLQRDASDGLRIPVALGAIAPVMLEATVSAEDRRFAQHPGLDPLALGRAILTAGSQPSGASTITQQLARRLYLAGDTRPVLVRKAHESFIALQLEARRSKADILGLYLNDVYYGRGAYGVEAAARAYFGTSAGNLDLAHAAYLAG